MKTLSDHMTNELPETQDETFMVSVNATPQGVRWALISLTRRLKGQLISEELVQKCELILAEIMNNIVEHALSGRENEKISLRITASPESIESEVIDCGLAMPRETLPSGDMPTLSDKEALPEGGFGWYLIKSQTDNLVYERKNGHNILKCSFSL